MSMIMSHIQSQVSISKDLIDLIKDLNMREKNLESVLTHFWCRPHTRTYEISIRFLGCCNLSSEHDFKLTSNSILSDQEQEEEQP